MLDLIVKVKAIDWESRKLATKGTEDLAIHDAEAVPHADVCGSCKVVGGCDDTHASCRLRTEFGLRADGTEVDKKAPIHQTYKKISAMNAEKVVVPVDQGLLF